MRRFPRMAVCALLLCLCAFPAAAGGVHLVLNLNIGPQQAGRRDEIVTQSIEVLRRRFAQTGITQAAVSRHGPNGIVADIVDYSDLGRVRGLVFLGGSIGFYLVDEDVTADDIRAGRVPAGVEFLEQRPAGPGDRPPPLAVYRVPIVAGERIGDARSELDSRTGEWVISFKFDSLGTRQFAKMTEENIGKRFAIVFNGKVLSAPSILDPVRGGAGEISGNFTEKEASDLAAAVRAGVLPAPWTIVELKQTP